MKQYIHPITKMTATERKDWHYTLKDENGIFCWNMYNEESVIGGWFIEKKEEPDTYTKWIDDAWEQYRSRVWLWDESDSAKSCKREFKKAILAHYPNK